MDEQAIIQNIQAREIAEETIQQIQFKINGMMNRKKQRALEIVWSWIYKQLEAKPRLPAVDFTPMSEEEANEFEHNTLGIGRYANTEVRAVPASYLEWLADAPDDGIKLMVRRYVNCPKFQWRLDRDERIDNQQ